MKEGTKKCPYCGEEILETAKKCKHCGEWLLSETELIIERNAKELPLAAKKYNWGPLCASVIWGFYNGMPKSLIIAIILLFFCSLIPSIGILASFCNFALLLWAGTKGNQWAWNYKNWNSVEEFNKHQNKWVIYPILISFTIGLIIGVIASIS